VFDHAAVLRVVLSSIDLSLVARGLLIKRLIVKVHLACVSDLSATEMRIAKGHVPSNALMRGLGSNACCAGPERLFAGTALSDKLSMKSFTMKSLLENVSTEKLGPLGNIDRPPLGFPAIPSDYEVEIMGAFM
jgi:hypothetical protein